MEFPDWPDNTEQTLPPNFLMSGVQVCATHQGQFLTFKNPEESPNFELFPEQALIFLFCSRTGSFVDNLVSNVKNPSCFPQNDGSNPNFSLKKVCLSFSKRHWVCACHISKLYSNKLILPVFPAAWCFYFCSIILEQSVSSSTYVFLFEFNMTLTMWITFNILRSCQMNKEYWVKSEQFISLNALPFHNELQLINYQDLTQDILEVLFVWLYLSTQKVTHNGKMLIFINTAFVIA